MLKFLGRLLFKLSFRPFLLIGSFVVVGLGLGISSQPLIYAAVIMLLWFVALEIIDDTNGR